MMPDDTKRYTRAFTIPADLPRRLPQPNRSERLAAILIVTWGFVVVGWILAKLYNAAAPYFVG